MCGTSKHRTFFVGITAWMSICLFVVGFFPDLGILFSKSWLLTGAIGIIASIGMANILTMEVRYNASLIRHHEMLAVTDVLTNLLNRRGFDHQLERLIGERQNAVSESSQVFLALVDVDHFKDVNDECGHPVGDKMLEFVASVLYELVPEKSVACRIGGDEFAILFVDQSPLQVAAILKDMKVAIDRETGNREDLVHSTISIGVTQFQTEDNYQSILQRADRALYRTKLSGRNRITFR